jgi:hypothetical protein
MTAMLIGAVKATAGYPDQRLCSIAIFVWRNASAEACPGFSKLGCVNPGAAAPRKFQFFTAYATIDIGFRILSQDRHTSGIVVMASLIELKFVALTPLLFGVSESA